MKQFILFAAALTVLSTAAQNGFLTQIDFIGYPNLVQYCEPNNEYIYTETIDENHNPIQWTIYDENFKSVKIITLQENEDIAEIEVNNNGLDTKFTQTLLNDDSEFEYIVQKYNSEGANSGFKIMQSNGNCLFNIDFDIIDKYNSASFEYWKFGKQLYLYYSHLDNYYVYKIDSNASNKALTLVKSTKAYPNPVEQGEPFTISGLKNALGANIFVNNMNGTTVLSSVCNENDKAVINTEKLTSGNYLYSIINNGNTIASGKLIIK